MSVPASDISSTRRILRFGAAVLARVGLNPAPAVQSVREFVTRPYRAATAAAIAELTDRLHDLEQLVAGLPAAVAPGSERAVAELGNPTVSVIMPTRNRADFIGEAIASVQRQSLTGWELVIVDDGSRDGTEAAVAPFLGDQRIRYLRQEHGGSSRARNHGIAASRGELIAYLDDDNVWYPDHLLRTVQCLATEPEVDVVYSALVSDHHQLDRRSILWRPFDHGVLLEGNFIDINVVVHRRALVAQHGGWDEALERFTDWELMLRYTAEKAARRVAVLGAFYRVCDNQRISVVVNGDSAEIPVRERWAMEPSQ